MIELLIIILKFLWDWFLPLYGIGTLLREFPLVTGVLPFKKGERKIEIPRDLESQFQIFKDRQGRKIIILAGNRKITFWSLGTIEISVSTNTNQPKNEENSS